MPATQLRRPPSPPRKGFNHGLLDGLGAPAADATHTATLLAVAEIGSGSQSEQLEVVVDTQAPAVDITAPAADACVIRDSLIEGSITDTRITSYTLIGLPPGGEPVLLDERSESRSGELASVATLSEGPQTLSVAAEDAARNRTTLDRSFIIDSIAPVVRITTLGEGAVLAANAGTVSVTGRVDDANLVEAALSFGPGIDPPFFAEIARTTVAGDGVALGDWNVSSLSDGSYTLLVVATDCSGSTSEVRASVTIDATPPTATIGDPAAGDAINGTLPITGTAADENLTGWELAFAPGEAASAFQWTPIATAQTGVVDATLAESWPFPPDGTHTLRLTVTDAPPNRRRSR